jgi:hypothetical protein
MDAISVVMKNSLQKSACSLKNINTIITVTTAPMPVNTAKAVPIGRVRLALYNSNILTLRLIKNPVIHNAAVDPDVSLAFARQVVNPISNKPATMRMIQFMKAKLGANGQKPMILTIDAPL